MTPVPPTRRDDPLEKTGYRIPRSVVSLVREAVEAGEAKSQNELVERALRRELRAIRQRRLYEEYAMAAADPAFMGEMGGEESVWSVSLGDGLAEGDA
jgi:Arc/MetJ-type ribon-helix-helix transcriptional regulator